MTAALVDWPVHPRNPMARPSLPAPRNTAALPVNWTAPAVLVSTACAGAAWWLGWVVLAAAAIAVPLAALVWQGQHLRRARARLAEAAQAAERAEQAQRVLLQAQQEALRANTLLERVIEALPVGIEIYDEAQRLVIFNQKLAEFYPKMDYAGNIGTPFETLLREAVARGIVPAAIGREEAWVQQRLAEHGRRGEVIQPLLSGPRHMRIHETRTPEGIVVTTRMEVTDLIHQQEALEAARQDALRSRQLLEAALEAMPIGIEIFDEQDRMVLHNQVLATLVPLPGDGSEIGQTFEAILRRNLAAGRIPDAVGREEAWLRERLAQRGRLNGPLLQRTSEDSWINTYETITPAGYVVSARADVSDLIRKEQELAAANELLAELSATDGLTGIANRRRFDEALAQEWLRATRAGTPLSLLLIDIDHFKAYNDHYGHLAGDECLRCVAQILSDCLRRAGELVARYGGEEFALLLPGAELEEAQALAQRCCERLREAAIDHSNSNTAAHLTLSIGAATISPLPSQKPELLITAADNALYRAKHAGRNRCVAAPPMLA